MLVRGAGPLKGGGGGGRFLGRKGGRELRLRRSGGKRGGGLSLVGRSHIRMVRVFGGLGL